MKTRALATILWFACVSASLLQACASVQPAPAPPALSPDEVTAQYRLGPGDQIRVTVYNQPTFTGDYPLDGSGYIAMPLIGPVKAGDSTSRALETLIAKRLSEDKVLVDPSVAVQISQFRPYYIMGEVSQPGAYPYASDLTVRKAVATARGYTYRANVRRVYIQRSGDRTERLFELTPDMPVLPGDTIRIPERLF